MSKWIVYPVTLFLKKYVSLFDDAISPYHKYIGVNTSERKSGTERKQKRKKLELVGAQLVL